MTTNPHATAEGQQHLSDCRALQQKLTEHLVGCGVSMPEENDGRPALSVHPTRDDTGRVRMTIEHLAALLGVSSKSLVDPDITLKGQVR